MIERLIPNLNVPSNTFGVVPKGIVSVSGDEGKSVAEVQGILPGHVSGGIEASLAVQTERGCWFQGGCPYSQTSVVDSWADKGLVVPRPEDRDARYVSIDDRKRSSFGFRLVP